MLQVSRIESIKDLALQGKSIAEIARIQGIDYKTAKRYVEQEDFTLPSQPVIRHYGSILDPYKEEIRSMMDESKAWSRKQRFTAKRIWVLLAEKHPEFTCSYNVVARFVKAYKQEQKVSSRFGYDELVWHPGEAQVDFGEADFRIAGKLERLKYLVVSFPASNMAFAQIFRGENSECVCQGLRDIFEHLGGVPLLLVFDNAPGVGRRMGEMLLEAHGIRRVVRGYKGWKRITETKVTKNLTSIFHPEDIIEAAFDVSPSAAIARLGFLNADINKYCTYKQD